MSNFFLWLGIFGSVSASDYEGSELQEGLEAVLWHNKLPRYNEDYCSVLASSGILAPLCPTSTSCKITDRHLKVS